MGVGRRQQRPTHTRRLQPLKSFQSDYIGNYASKEDFAEELAKMENELSDFALSYFDFSKYADDLFDTDFWYKDGYVFRNN